MFDTGIINGCGDVTKELSEDISGSAVISGGSADTNDASSAAIVINGCIVVGTGVCDTVSGTGVVTKELSDDVIGCVVELNEGSAAISGGTGVKKDTSSDTGIING